MACQAWPVQAPETAHAADPPQVAAVALGREGSPALLPVAEGTPLDRAALPRGVAVVPALPAGVPPRRGGLRRGALRPPQGALLGRWREGTPLRAYCPGCGCRQGSHCSLELQTATTGRLYCRPLSETSVKAEHPCPLRNSILSSSKHQPSVPQYWPSHIP